MTKREAALSMADTSAAATPELIDIIHRVSRLRARMKPVLPEDMQRLKSLLDTPGLNGKAGDTSTFRLLFDLGTALSQHEEGMTMGELSKMLDMPLSSATRIVDSLVSSQYAIRRADDADRRIVRVAFTPAGEAIFQATNDFLRQRIEKLLRIFDPAEQKQFLKLMTKLVTALEQEPLENERTQTR